MPKTKQINIFVGLSQNQVDNFELVIKQTGIEHEHNILLTSSSISYNPQIYKEVYQADISFDNQSGNTFQAIRNIHQKIRAYKKLIQKIKSFKSEKKIRVYFSYIEDVLSNHMVLSFNKNTRAIVVEDGILNYYMHTIHNLPRHKILLKYLISNLNGVRFKFYKGHSSGIDYAHVEKQYVRLPELSVKPEKSEKLQVPPIFIENFSDSAIIIGKEELEGKIGSEQYYSKMNLLFDKAIELAKNKKIKKIYYKPHRHGKRLSEEFIKTKLQSIPYEILNASAPLENLFFNQLRSKYIIGFNSSAIINIKIQLKNANELKTYVFMEKDDILRNLFKKLNSNILEM